MRRGEHIVTSSDSLLLQTGQTISERLNKSCLCITLDRDALDKALERELDDTDFSATFTATRPHLFANSSVFLSDMDNVRMLQLVRAVEAASRLSGYQATVLSWAPQIARIDNGPEGVFMGYDFHLTADGPKLIEVNTNAGGAFLNAILAKTQRACCGEIEFAQNKSEAGHFELAVIRMFEREWIRQRAVGMPQRVAIVDDNTHEQYLYPEFVLAQRFFLKHGIEAVIVDADKLRYENGRLQIGHLPIDLVYNRLVDFSLEHPQHAALRAAYLDKAVVVTPNPRIHALFADKRNLTLLSNPKQLCSWGLSQDMIADLAGVPHTVVVTPENAKHLWDSRKKLFFKPASGHGGKAVYRGDKLTKGVWAKIIAGEYVAQDFAEPSERIIKLDDVSETRKTDVRLYVYNGQVLLTAARLYQGQTTNFRTPGGGFAPVFVL